MIERVEIVLGDITKLKVDAIVNAANSTLLGGGGVDGAIHRASGPDLLEECRTLNGCPTGQAKITEAYNLPSISVIHTVGPVWQGGKNNEEEMLKNCYFNSLKIASQNRMKSVAFPAISTGVYRFPVELATYIAVKTCIEFIDKSEYPQKVLFVCFSNHIREIYNRILSEELHNL